jgi:hypothetical protein
MTKFALGFMQQTKGRKWVGRGGMGPNLVLELLHLLHLAHDAVGGGLEILELEDPGVLPASPSEVVRGYQPQRTIHVANSPRQRLLGVPRAGTEALQGAVAREPLPSGHVLWGLDLNDGEKSARSIISGDISPITEWSPHRETRGLLPPCSGPVA